ELWLRRGRIARYRHALVAKADPQPPTAVLKERTRLSLGQAFRRFEPQRLIAARPIQRSEPAQPHRAGPLGDHPRDEVRSPCGAEGDTLEQDRATPPRVVSIQVWVHNWIRLDRGSVICTDPDSAPSAFPDHLDVLVREAFGRGDALAVAHLQIGALESVESLVSTDPPVAPMVLKDSRPRNVEGLRLRSLDRYDPSSDDLKESVALCADVHASVLAREDLADGSVGKPVRRRKADDGLTRQFVDALERCPNPQIPVSIFTQGADPVHAQPLSRRVQGLTTVDGELDQTAGPTKPERPGGIHGQRLDPHPRCESDGHPSPLSAPCELGGI